LHLSVLLRVCISCARLEHLPLLILSQKI